MYYYYGWYAVACWVPPYLTPSPKERFRKTGFKRRIGRKVRAPHVHVPTQVVHKNYSGYGRILNKER